ncbi:MAG: aminotransferase class IV [Muribaculaceae bacterium]|nr:aminotransferase class IV [Muribaculaceae bacterium]
MLLETIRIVAGEFCNTDLHLERMHRSTMELYGCAAPTPDFDPALIPESLRAATAKCRILYDADSYTMEFHPYTPRTVRSLRFTEANDIDYHLKYADRSALDSLAQKKGDADEILIVNQGLVSDTTYSNIICIGAEGRWLTPRRPLLRGVMRQWLLNSGVVEEADITPEMLRPGNSAGISAVVMINAMLPPGATPPVPVENIVGL